MSFSNPDVLSDALEKTEGTRFFEEVGLERCQVFFWGGGVGGVDPR